ncbi:KEOPS complex subunit Cgi121 [Halomicrobium zhouii]|uniref:KEOPS complex subunit Cgi121 n=1 Tax=Halomicrobium zhouii TaxID=767519 RepID=A0A1I6K708_9EURY|nr:KEOPS complex subunit Cgi121 [Halomicrobium zhouii]SFR86650.1 KEOPS complex subunit Cgi121 [Halomicrobium zhouii]
MELVEGVATVDDVDDFVEWLGTIGEEHGVAVQAFDARYVVDREHLERAVELADRAFARDDAIARDRSVEILLYAAGRRQINRALEMGVGEGETPVAVVVHAPDEDGDESGAVAAVADLLEPADTLGEYDEALVRKFFDVGERELAATDGTLADLVRERVALLTVEK